MQLAARDDTACVRCSRDGRDVPSLRVLHVLEATLGGTRRILAESAATTLGSPIVQGLVYGTSRADKDFQHLLDRVRSAGWYLAPIDSMRRPVNVLDDTRAIAKLRLAIREFKPTVMHLRSAKAGGIGRLAAASLGNNRPKIVYSPHALPTHLGGKYMYAEKMLAPWADRFMADSESERHEIISKGIATADAVDVVYPAIDASFYAPRDRSSARRELDLPDGVPIVVGIGRLCFQKDPLSFVATIARLRVQYPDLIGVWVGDGELRGEVEARARALQLGNSFRISGWLGDVRPHVAASDIVLSTSRYESLGLFVAEAFAMERPVVASRITGTVDVFFPAAKPFLYSLGDTAAAAALLDRLLSDASLRDEQGRLGRESLDRFSHAAMHAAQCRSYEAVLAYKRNRFKYVSTELALPK